MLSSHGHLEAILSTVVKRRSNEQDLTSKSEKECFLAGWSASQNIAFPSSDYYQREYISWGSSCESSRKSKRESQLYATNESFRRTQHLCWYVVLRIEPGAACTPDPEGERKLQSAVGLMWGRLKEESQLMLQALHSWDSKVWPGVWPGDLMAMLEKGQRGVPF
ncbi:uncharacterized protein LOC110598608 isoform X2 [Ictidomys tridecemlineatus]